MAVSSVDYEKVDVTLLQALQTIKVMENFLTSGLNSTVPGTDVFVAALDAFRNEIAMEIERQGAR